MTSKNPKAALVTASLLFCWASGLPALIAILRPPKRMIARRIRLAMIRALGRILVMKLRMPSPPLGINRLGRVNPPAPNWLRRVAPVLWFNSRFPSGSGVPTARIKAMGLA